jgi:DNA-binding MarR family transcriptional regulator
MAIVRRAAVKAGRPAASSVDTGAGKAGKGEPQELTVGVEALLVAGNDAAFRDFVADLFAAASGMLAVRRGLGKSTGLTGSEIAMLLAIRRLSGETPSVGVRAIAEHLHVAGPHVTAEVGKLVEAGLVEKRTDKSDNRAVDIRLTAEGRQALRRLTPMVRAANDVLFAGMSETEMAHVHRFLRRIVATSAEAVRRLD